METSIYLGTDCFVFCRNVIWGKLLKAKSFISWNKISTKFIPMKQKTFLSELVSLND